jgi:hypothetical protein
VGAPFFFSREDGGAVYIYNNNKTHCLDCKKPLRLTGKPESRFAAVLSELICKTVEYQFLLTDPVLSINVILDIVHNIRQSAESP